MMGIDSCGMLLSAVHEEDGEEKLNAVYLNMGGELVRNSIDPRLRAEVFMDYDTAISFFRGLIEAGKEVPEEEWDLAA